jgi:hypothetical protein
MGIRGELFSSRVGCEGRTYFFNVKENRMGDMFLTVVESKPTEAEGFERRSVVIFRDDLPDFLKAFQGALDFMGKSEGATSAPKYSPADKQAPKRRASPSGFAGSESGEASPKPGEASPRRKIVVRRKSAEPKDKG